jgi:predicted aspartyl protease
MVNMLWSPWHRSFSSPQRPSTRSLWPILTLVVTLAAACSSTSPVTEADLPVQLVNNLLFVPVRVGSSEVLSFILDTGASATVFDRTVAERLGLDLHASEDARTGGGSVQTASATGIALSIGNASLPDLTIVAIDLSGLQAGLGRPVDGILGYDIFRRYVVEIDYVANRVRLHDPTEDSHNGQGDILPIVIEEQIPFAQVQLRRSTGETGDAKVKFDTGQTGAMTLVKSYVEANHLVTAQQPRLQIRTGAILSGGVAAEVVRISEIRLGPFVVTNPVVNVAITLNDLRQRLRVPGQRFALTLKRGDTTIERIITTRRLI